jgi:hypothetical protein
MANAATAAGEPVTPSARPGALVKLGTLRRSLGVSGETVRRWRAAGKLPPPDVDLGGPSVWWHLATLAAAGVRLQPTEREARAVVPLGRGAEGA